MPVKPKIYRYSRLLSNIGKTVETARNNAIVSVNAELVRANWEIGKHIIEFEQHGNERAEYGSDLLARLSNDLRLRHGKGFSRRNVLDMRRFYLLYENWSFVSGKLSWSHYIMLTAVADEQARKFYEKQTIHENWSVRELERQISSSLFERLALSRDKKGVKRLAERGNIAYDASEVVKDPYVLDFLKIEQSKKLTEKDFEQRLIDNLQLFLLELGKGFTYVGRQYKISFRNRHFYIDLVFYHRILKCFVLIDIKAKPVEHNDIGQMNLYLNYFKSEESVESDSEPIGIILSADKDDVMVEYAKGGLSNKIFVSKYQLYLPPKKQLQRKLKTLIDRKRVSRNRKQ